MDAKTKLCYRGSLKSCNYSCSYCPFSKKKTTVKELKQDQEALFRFVKSIEERYHHVQAVQIVPYGEALIHDYYWEALARLSSVSNIQAIGAQTNASFSVDRKLEVFYISGGERSKLRLWLSFHPSMISLEKFLKQCELLEKSHISYCVGAVGMMENLPLIQQLRSQLPEHIYMWINKPDISKYNTSYKPTMEEVEAFLKVDPYYTLECRHYPAREEFCAEYAFVEADGSVKLCNISQTVLGNWYQDSKETDDMEKHCNKKECNCYLAYCRRKDDERLQDFGLFPMFRIPVSQVLHKK